MQRSTLDTGRYLELFVEDSGIPHIVYHNATDGALEYASFVNSGGNCGFSSLSSQFEWQCDWIDDMGTSVTSMGIAMEPDEFGHPIIAYQDATSPIGGGSLKIAQPYGATTGWSATPNCGPLDPTHTWVCEVLSEGGMDLSEADSVSMTTNPRGEATIAYRELNSYPYPPEGSLKVAFEPRFVFGDDFELGDTLAWSAGAP